VGRQLVPATYCFLKQPSNPTSLTLVTIYKIYKMGNIHSTPGHSLAPLGYLGGGEITGLDALAKVTAGLHAS
jgi:hypothetical protein